MAMSKIITWISALIIGWIIYAIYNSVHFLRILQYWKAPLRKPVLNLQAHGFAQATALFKSDLLSTLQLGHRTFPNSIYQLWTPIGYQIVLPRHFLDELKDLGEDFLSFNHYVQDDQIGLYNWFDLAGPSVGGVTHRKLNPQLGAILPTMVSEIQYGFETHMKKSKDWLLVNIHEVLLHITAIVSGAIFVSRDAGHDPVWENAQVDFTKDFVAAARLITDMSPMSRVLRTAFLKPVRNCSTYKAVGVNVIQANRRRSVQATAEGKAPPNVLVEWIDEEYGPKTAVMTDGDMSNLMLITSFDAMYTVSELCTQVLLDLALRHESYLDDLRKEVDEVWPSWDAPIEQKTISKMLKLDSFIQESQRLSPLSLTGFQRKVMQPITLSDGTKLPAGSHLFISNYTSSTDPEKWESPLEFRGDRFLNLPAAQTGKIPQKLGVARLNEMTFGIGKHACPGRFYAVMEIKLILASIIRDYDIRLEAEDEVKKGLSAFGWLVFARENVQLMFRNRQRKSNA